MDPENQVGNRKELTLLDLAFLRDIGYETVVPTFPPDYDGDGDVDGADLAHEQDRMERPHHLYAKCLLLMRNRVRELDGISLRHLIS